MLQITRISAQKNNENTYNLFCDRGYLISVTGDDILEYKLSKGTVINESLLKKLTFSFCLTRLVNSSYYYLSIRQHSENEMYRYLQNKMLQIVRESKTNAIINLSDLIDENDQKAIILKVVNTLKEKDYINDKNFAVWLISSRIASKSKKSKRAIVHELKLKGISQEVITEAISSYTDDHETEMAREIAEKKYLQLSKKEENTYKIKSKLYSFLSYKGYSYETINRVIDSIMSPSYNNGR